MVPEVWRLRQKDHDFKARLGYTVSFCPERHGGRRDRQRNTSKGDQAATIRRLAWRADATALAGESLKWPRTQRGEGALRDWRGMLGLKATPKGLPVAQGEPR